MASQKMRTILNIRSKWWPI